MTNAPRWLAEIPAWERILAFVAIAVAAHVAARLVRSISVWMLGVGKGRLESRYARFATLTSLIVSIVTFSVYFGAFGLILQELGVPLRTYLASATVIGLAVGFGLQGLVQDLVIGLTLIFSDVLNVGDIVELSGPSGRVERIGLRFTTLTNFVGQEIYLPNRNIAQISRYRHGAVRAYVDIQSPDGDDGGVVAGRMLEIARGMHRQYPAVVRTEPRTVGIFGAEPGGWTYARLEFGLWPGQTAVIEQTFKQRALADLRATDPDYGDWMITVTYGAE